MNFLQENIVDCGNYRDSYIMQIVLVLLPEVRAIYPKD